MKPAVAENTLIFVRQVFFYLSKISIKTHILYFILMYNDMRNTLPQAGS